MAKAKKVLKSGKRGPGRPKKVESTIAEIKVKKVHKPYEKRKTAEDIEFEKNELVKNQKTGKHMGYCPSCESVVADFDITDGRYTCLGCQSEGLVKKLKVERENRQVWSSKREYLSQTFFSFGGVFGGGHSGHNAEVEDKTEDHEDLPEDTKE